MPRKQYRFWVRDEELKKFLDSQHNFTEFALEVFNLVMQNKLSPETIEALERRKLQADVIFRENRAELTAQQAKYAKWKNDFIDNFGTEPTPEALKTLKKEQKEEQTRRAVAEQTNQQLLDQNYQRFVTIKSISKEEWFASCDLCDFNDHYNKIAYTIEQIHEEMKKHIAALHMEKILS